jgi:predicted DNA-binding protein with PD1-like motif
MNVKEHLKEAKIKRVITGRIPRGVDLLTGIKEICNEYGIKHGFSPMILGSLDTGRFIYAIPKEGTPIGFAYSEPVDLRGPLELLSASALIGVEETGELSVHLHMLVSDCYMRVFGGHFVEGGNIVAATAEIVIYEIDEAEFIRKFDEGTGFKLFKIQ